MAGLDRFHCTWGEWVGWTYMVGGMKDTWLGGERVGCTWLGYEGYMGVVWGERVGCTWLGYEGYMGVVWGERVGCTWLGVWGGGVGPMREWDWHQRRRDVYSLSLYNSSTLLCFDALSWLTTDHSTRQRRTCLPIHLFILSKLYHLFSTLDQN